jgi:tRNA nucleotidyltransferase (CCA-adding enzyme)
VFLHPKTQAEYALARTERKSAPGYRGFVFHYAPNVSLEEDLQRRDLTINAMAVADDDPSHTHIIDPYGGQADLAAKMFRHVSDAFSEDPVRILRVARLAARFTDFTVAPETMTLMRHMVEVGEVDALVPERVWQELARGLMEAQPSRMLDILRACGALARILPELGERIVVNQAIDHAAQCQFSLAVRGAAMFIATQGDDAFATLKHVCQRIKVPNEVRDVALLAYQERTPIENALTLEPAALVRLLERCDAFRRPQRFVHITEAIVSVHPKVSHLPQQEYLNKALATCQSIPTHDIVHITQLQFPDQPLEIAKAIFAERVKAVKTDNPH